MFNMVDDVGKLVCILWFSFLGFSLAGPCIKGLDDIDMKRGPSVRFTPTGNIIKASQKLAGYFPTRGYDDDKDGSIDRVEQYMHGAPRIPFGSWHKVDRRDPLFKAVQKEYTVYLKARPNLISSFGYNRGRY